MARNFLHANDFNPANIAFDEVVTDPKFNTKRINIRYMYGKSKGDLTFITDELFSYGIQEKRMNSDSSVKQPLNGYSLPLILYDKENASPSEKAFENALNVIAETCKDYLISIRKTLKKFDLEKSQLKKIMGSLFYKKDEEGERIPDAPPTLYANLLATRIPDEEDGFVIKTKFFDNATNAQVDPFSLLGKRLRCVSLIKIESIFIGTTMSIQIKVLQTRVAVQESGSSCLIPSFGGGSIKPPSSAPLTLLESDYATTAATSKQFEDAISETSSEEEEFSPTPAEPVAKGRRTAQRKKL